MSETKTIELSPTCRIVHCTWENFPCSVELEYVEHATDHWHHDSDTSVAISEKDAEKIIAFLRNAFPNLR
jgi:hypothetical protein